MDKEKTVTEDLIYEPEMVSSIEVKETDNFTYYLFIEYELPDKTPLHSQMIEMSSKYEAFSLLHNISKKLPKNNPNTHE